MGKREVLLALVDQKKLAIAKALALAKEEVYLKELASECNVSLTSTYRILQELVEADIVEKRLWKTSTVYKCRENAKGKFLRDLLYEEFDGVAVFVDYVKRVEGVESIIQQGTAKKGKANLLVIGSRIDPKVIQGICENIREKGCSISFLILGRGQYEQMSKMGLYGGEKKVLH